MRLPLTVLVSISVMVGSSSSAPAPEKNGLKFFEHLGPSALKFNWSNITCSTCKVLFIIVDIALLVTIIVLEFRLNLNLTTVQSLAN